jgi:hypothetical protein
VVSLLTPEYKTTSKKVPFVAVAVLERISKPINCNGEIGPHEAYEEELEKRMRSALSPSSK